ncbi:MAG: four helix bundle protein [bacterium]|nr:four helix bundle protein [bacterium]
MDLSNTNKITSFTHLDAWRESHALVLMTYKISKSFPKEEIFGLTSQMRRAAVSVSSNIAEGFSRNTKRDKQQFYAIAKGSLTELQNQYIICRDLGYITKDDFNTIAKKTVDVSKLINGLIRSSNSKPEQSQ